jgi:hypothetical protein
MEKWPAKANMKKNTLTRYGYSAMKPEKTRREALSKAVRALGWVHVERALLFEQNMNSGHEGSYECRFPHMDDLAWLRHTHGGP